MVDRRGGGGLYCLHDMIEVIYFQAGLYCKIF